MPDKRETERETGKTVGAETVGRARPDDSVTMDPGEIERLDKQSAETTQQIKTPTENAGESQGSSYRK